MDNGFLQVTEAIYSSFQEYYDSQESQRSYAQKYLSNQEEGRERKIERLRRLGILE